MKRRVLLTAIFALLLVPAALAMAAVPVCDPVRVNGLEGQGTISIDLPCNDEDNDIASVVIVSQPQTPVPQPEWDFGWRTGYTIPAGWFGTDSFTFKAIDDQSQESAVAQATVTVSAAPEGGLLRIEDEHACLADSQYYPCGVSRGMASPSDLIASPDGKHLYVIGIQNGSIATVRRDPATGMISQPLFPEACFSSNGNEGCQAQAALSGIQYGNISADGKNLYVTSSVGNTLATFSRSADTGLLTFAGCMNADGSHGCDTGNSAALTGVRDVIVSPDGKFAYTLAGGLDGAVLGIFARAADGALTFSGCVTDTVDGCTEGMRGVAQPIRAAISPDGKHLYVAAYSSHAIAVLVRDPVSGALSQNAGQAGCISQDGSEGCAVGRELNTAIRVAVSPDGAAVYSITDGSTAAAFVRNPESGALLQPASAAGCINLSGTGPCLAASGIGGGLAALVVDPFSRVIHIAGGANRNILTFRKAEDGGFAAIEGGFADVAVDRYSLFGINAFVLSPDGLFGYGVGSPDAIYTHRRNLTPRCTGGSVSVMAGASVNLSLLCTDPNGDSIVRAITHGPSQGTVSEIDQTAASAVYTADSTAFGSDTITFAGSDGVFGEDAVITVTIDLDPSDQCPADGAKQEPGLCGCGNPELDSDGDGFIDCGEEPGPAGPDTDLNEPPVLGDPELLGEDFVNLPVTMRPFNGTAILAGRVRMVYQVIVRAIKAGGARRRNIVRASRNNSTVVRRLSRGDTVSVRYRLVFYRGRNEIGRTKLSPAARLELP